MIPGVRCATCAFFSPPPFEARGRVEFGQCRRYAPTLDLSEGAPRTRWPLVPATAFCGDHATVES